MVTNRITVLQNINCKHVYAKASQDSSIKSVSDVRHLLNSYRTMCRITAPKQNINNFNENLHLIQSIPFAGAGENYENTMTAFQRYVCSLIPSYK